MMEKLEIHYKSSTSLRILGYIFWCPGCHKKHTFVTDRIDGKPEPKWIFNGDMEKPSFSPSLLLHSHPTIDLCGNQVSTPRCHLYLRNGRIQFLSDCTHKLAGKTVSLQTEPPLEERTDP